MACVAVGADQQDRAVLVAVCSEEMRAHFGDLIRRHAECRRHRTAEAVGLAAETPRECFLQLLQRTRGLLRYDDRVHDTSWPEIAVNRSPG